MTTTAFNLANFRAQFPEFAAVPDATLQAYWNTGTAFVSKYNGDTCIYTQEQAQLANDLMCAHLTALSLKIASGQVAGIMTQATEGTVSISLMPPPVKSAFGFWLAQTPYGAELRALLDLLASLGFYIGGSPERAAFRKAGGWFGR